MDKILKITIETDKETKVLTGEQAQKWMDLIDGMCANLENRGQNPFAWNSFDWVKTPKPEPPPRMPIMDEHF